jgi:beta-xylosidase
MTELDGPIEKIALPNYTEGPWLSKRKGMYYMTYASMAHQELWEHLSYATAPSPRGPWTYQGLLTGPREKQLHHPRGRHRRLQGPVLSRSITTAR